jgi:hypothetical protein
MCFFLPETSQIYEDESGLKASNQEEEEEEEEEVRKNAGLATSCYLVYRALERYSTSFQEPSLHRRFTST